MNELSHGLPWEKKKAVVPDSSGQPSAGTHADKEAGETVEEVAPEGGGIGQQTAGSANSHEAGAEQRRSTPTSKPAMSKMASPENLVTVGVGNRHCLINQA